MSKWTCLKYFEISCSICLKSQEIHSTYLRTRIIDQDWFDQRWPPFCLCKVAISYRVWYIYNHVVLKLAFDASAFRRQRHYVFGFSVRPSVRPSEARNTVFPPVHGSVGPSDQTWPFFGMSVRPSVPPSVRPERFPDICWRTLGGNGLKFYMLMYHKNNNNNNNNNDNNNDDDDDDDDADDDDDDNNNNLLIYIAPNRNVLQCCTYNTNKTYKAIKYIGVIQLWYSFLKKICFKIGFKCCQCGTQPNVLRKCVPECGPGNRESPISIKFKPKGGNWDIQK